jgi:hypothetical protein|tara:strand:+ start:286 stop:429 length:144 start_codon:yes stop_codon:yes gene_type:complete
MLCKTTGILGGAMTLIGWYAFKPTLIILGGIFSLGGGLISMYECNDN